MKKILFFLTMLALASMILIGCSDDSNPTNPTNPDPETNELILPAGYAWVTPFDDYGYRVAQIFKNDGRNENYDYRNGSWHFDDEESGTYRVNGNTLTFISPHGFSFKTTFSVSADQLTITWPDGESLVFNKEAFNPGSDNPDPNGLILPAGYAWVASSYAIRFNSNGIVETFEYYGGSWHIDEILHYSVNGNTITSTDEDGDTFTSTFSISGNTLTMVEGEDTFVYTKQAFNP